MATEDSMITLDQMIAEQKARMTPTELEAYEAFSLLSWDEKMTIMQANQRAIEQAVKQEEEPLQQTIVDNIVEKIQHATVNTDSSTVNNVPLLSMIPRDTATSMHREVFIRFDKTPMHLLASRLTSRLASRATFLCQHAWPPPYIEYAKDMEATGQG